MSCITNQEALDFKKEYYDQCLVLEEDECHWCAEKSIVRLPGFMLSLAVPKSKKQSTRMLFTSRTSLWLQTPDISQDVATGSWRNGLGPFLEE